MASNWLSTIFSGSKTEGDAISASTLNVTKIVSIFVAIFAGITQTLDSTGVAGLSTTQMVTIWLVVAGLVVLLSISDMICRAYVTAKMYGSGGASMAGLDLHVKVQKQGVKDHRDAKLLDILTGGTGQFARVQWTDGKADDGKDEWVPYDEVKPL